MGVLWVRFMMEKPKKEISENDVLAAILKVKPTEDMPRRKPKRKESKEQEKSKK
jgi:hypothetical protein